MIVTPGSKPIYYYGNNGILKLLSIMKWELPLPEVKLRIILLYKRRLCTLTLSKYTLFVLCGV